MTLSPREYALLYTLACQPGTVLSKTRLLRMVWGGEQAATGNVVEVYIGYLRRKLNEIGAPALISTVPSHGYQLAAGEAHTAKVG